MEDIMTQIEELKAQIAQLPIGYISRKTINGKLRLYHQWTEDGKKKSKYLNAESAAMLESLIQQRRELQQKLSVLEACRPSSFYLHEDDVEDKYKCNVLTGEKLRKFSNIAKSFKHRRCFDAIENYLKQEPEAKVLILYGLRRTGKTTLIRQALLSMTPAEFVHSAFIQITKDLSLADLNSDLKQLEKNGFKYIFIDEITFLNDFIEGAALFSDIFAACGMKIVLSGTDSLGFLFSEDEQLFDRCIMLHTSFISYGEFEEVLGIKGIDEYIKYSGTMTLSGSDYNNTSMFSSKASADEYVDSAIAKNIQHSLRNYQDGSHFRSLKELYEKNELTSAINRVVEDLNHNFTVDVLTREFDSHDLGISKRNLIKDKEKSSDVLYRIDKDAFNYGLRKCLDILNKAQQSVDIKESHRSEIEEYLKLLDLIAYVDTEYIPADNTEEHVTIFTQPGLRYAQAKAVVENVMKDKALKDISAAERKRIESRILEEIMGRMMEEIVLLETSIARKDKRVLKIKFAVGEFDMLVYDPDDVSCEIYEIKHSSETDKAQYRHMVDKQKCADIEFNYGPITRKCVIYRGPSCNIDGIEYMNVEEYLKQLVCYSKH